MRNAIRSEVLFPIVKVILSAQAQVTVKETNLCVSSVGHSFTVGLSESDFPTMDDSLDGVVNESDLVPDIPEAAGLLEPRGAGRGLPTDEDINFVSTHFGDSSDDDDDFSAGLVFRRTPPPPPPTGTVPVVVMETSRYGALLQAAAAAAPSTNAVMTSLVGNFVSSETLLSSIGHHLASALGAGGVHAAPPGGEEPAAAGLEEEEEETTGKELTASESSLDEEFELISDDDLH